MQTDEINDWLDNRISVISSALRSEERFSDSTLRFEFWTCGTFDEDAMALLKKARAGTRRYQIEWKDGAAVRDYAAK